MYVWLRKVIFQLKINSASMYNQYDSSGGHTVVYSKREGLTYMSMLTVKTCICYSQIPKFITINPN